MFILEFAKFKERHILSGIALKVDDKLCLVLPKKFKGKNKYSIPKGHIEPEYSSFQSAYLELKEETGIDIGLCGYDHQFRYSYTKNKVKKILTVYVIEMDKQEYLELSKTKRHKKEIVDVVFYNKQKALEKVEPVFRKLIKHIFK
jgi:8-oxo-dGTP pyrophosphatase MutT (NUDIX family)